MCGIAPANVDDCGRFGDPACPYFGVGEPEPEGVIAPSNRPIISAPKLSVFAVNRPTTEPEGLPPRVGHILRLAEIIREVDGTHRLGAAALAEAILAHPAARTAMAQPEPVGATDEELLRVYGIAKRDHCYEGPIDDWPKRAERAATVHGLHAVLARWGRPAIEPVPVAERLPELRGMFERILCVARSSGGPLVGNIQLADRLLDAFVGWAGDALPAPGAEVQS